MKMPLCTLLSLAFMFLALSHPVNSAAATQHSPHTAQSRVIMPLTKTGRIDRNAETPIRALVGDWTVVGVWAGGDVSAFVIDDVAIMGSMVAITASSISWSKTTSRDFESSDVCIEPTTKLILAHPSLDPRFGLAFEQFGLTQVQIGNWHEVWCDKAGVWGASAAGGSTFYPVSDDRLVMNWYDDTILLLKRNP